MYSAAADIEHSVHACHSRSSSLSVVSDRSVTATNLHSHPCSLLHTARLYVRCPCRLAGSSLYPSLRLSLAAFPSARPAFVHYRQAVLILSGAAVVCTRPAAAWIIAGDCGGTLVQCPAGHRARMRLRWLAGRLACGFHHCRL